MKKRTPKENLKSFSLVYIILAVFYLVAALIFDFVPNIADSMKEYTGDKDIVLGLNVTAAVNILICFWYYWLARRVVNGKSNGTFYMLLLLLGVIGQLVSAIMTKSLVLLSSIDFFVDALGLYYLCKVRSEK